MERKAIYAASFDPFTNGHLDILRKASNMFDEVHALIAVNKDKQRKFHPGYMKDAIEAVILREGLTNCKVFGYNGPVAQYCAENGIGWAVRGLRNFIDFGYEENIANINKRINPLLETIYLRADNVDISSTAVKELFSYNIDVSEMVPPEILPVLRTFY